MKRSCGRLASRGMGISRNNGHKKRVLHQNVCTATLALDETEAQKPIIYRQGSDFVCPGEAQGENREATTSCNSRREQRNRRRVKPETSCLEAKAPSCGVLRGAGYGPSTTPFQSNSAAGGQTTLAEGQRKVAAALEMNCPLRDRTRLPVEPRILVRVQQRIAVRYQYQYLVRDKVTGQSLPVRKSGTREWTPQREFDQEGPDCQLTRSRRGMLASHLACSTCQPPPCCLRISAITGHGCRIG